MPSSSMPKTSHNLAGKALRSGGLRLGTAEKATAEDDVEFLPGNVGSTAVATATAYEVASVVRQAIITLTATPIVLADEAGVVAYGGLKIYDFPQGAIQILGAVADLDVTKSSAGVNADWDGDFGIGTVTAGNNNALATTEQNILPTTATPQAVAGVTTANGQSTITEAGLVIDGTATAADAYLNFLVDDADHNVGGTACNLLVTGTVKITYILLGDY